MTTKELTLEEFNETLNKIVNLKVGIRRKILANKKYLKHYGY